MPTGPDGSRSHRSIFHVMGPRSRCRSATFHSAIARERRQSRQRCSSAAAQLVRHRVAPVKLVAAGTAVQEPRAPQRASESCGREQEVRSRGGSEHQARTVAAAPRQSKAVPSRRSARPASRSRAHALRSAEGSRCVCVCARRCALQCISFRLLSTASICIYIHIHTHTVHTHKVHVRTALCVWTGAQQH